MGRIITCYRCGFAGAEERSREETLPDGGTLILNSIYCPACDGLVRYEDGHWEENPFLHAREPEEGPDL